jgi:hypothetical protein
LRRPPTRSAASNRSALTGRVQHPPTYGGLGSLRRIVAARLLCCFSDLPAKLARLVYRPAMSKPDRWMHLRSPAPFTDEQFQQFQAHCHVFQGFVDAACASWTQLSSTHEGNPPAYEFFEPELSEDRRTATLPLGGYQTLGSRHAFEDTSSRMLWRWFPLDFFKSLEEGPTERNHAGELETSWRRVEAMRVHMFW